MYINNPGCMLGRHNLNEATSVFLLTLHYDKTKINSKSCLEKTRFYF
jgi:hypothetical protein